LRLSRVPTPHNRSQHIQANTTRGFIQSVLLTMGIMMPETWWVNLLWINIYTCEICWFFLLLPLDFKTSSNLLLTLEWFLVLCMKQSMPADSDWFWVGRRELHLLGSLPRITKLPLFALLTSPYQAIEMSCWKKRLTKTLLFSDIQIEETVT